MDITHKNELQTHQCMDSRHMQKSTVLTKTYWENTLVTDKNILGEHSSNYLV